MKSANRSYGYTIVELLVIVLIIGLLAALATPKLSVMVETIKLRTAANAIKRQLIIARTRALADPNIHVGVYVNTRVTPNQSFVFLDLPTGTLNHYDWNSDPVYMGTYTAPNGVHDSLPSVAAGGVQDSVVVFRGDGSAKNGGSIIVVNSLGTIRTISVLPSTGRVKVQ